MRVIITRRACGVKVGEHAFVYDDGGTLTYTYDPAHKHAVTQIGSQYFCYDANGNMVKRGASDSACASDGDTLAYDYENRLTSITVGANTTTDH